MKLKSVVQAPFNLCDFILEQIENETRIAKKGGRGELIARMNSLVDRSVIEALYRASNAGVKIQLIVRGICVLQPGIEGLSENIRVVSILGRFLEHSREFYFRNEGKEKMYMSSADWMPRNFYSRVEIAVPLPGSLIERAREECLDFYLRDNQFSWQLCSDGSYRRLSPGKDTPFSAQQALMQRLGSDLN